MYRKTIRHGSVRLKYTSQQATQRNFPRKFKLQQLSTGGERLLKIYDHFEWAHGKDKNHPQDVFRKIEQYCNPRKNEVAESHKFWSTKYFEPFDQCLTELRIKASPCNFKEEDRMIRDKIVFTWFSPLIGQKTHSLPVLVSIIYFNSKCF